MEKKHNQEIEIPNGINCEVAGNMLICKKDSHSSERKITLPNTKLTVQGNKIFIILEKENRKTVANAGSFAAHIKNMFQGLSEKFVYELEICNVHFPMTVKVEGNKVVINNFLGEKEKRIAEILPHVNVEVKGQKITVSSHNLEAAGQTAANIETVTKISKRDRRIFQDGIFITSKCGRPI